MFFSFSSQNEEKLCFSKFFQTRIKIRFHNYSRFSFFQETRAAGVGSRGDRPSAETAPETQAVGLQLRLGQVPEAGPGEDAGPAGVLRAGRNT